MFAPAFVALLAWCAHGQGAAHDAQPAAPRPRRGPRRAEGSGVRGLRARGRQQRSRRIFREGRSPPRVSDEHGSGAPVRAARPRSGSRRCSRCRQTAEVYRVLWVRSGGHPVSVRFERQGRHGTAPGRPDRREGPRRPGRAPRGVQRAASRRISVRDLLARVRGGASSGHPPRPRPGVPLADAARLWVFEGGPGRGVPGPGLPARDAGPRRRVQRARPGPWSALGPAHPGRGRLSPSDQGRRGLADCSPRDPRPELERPPR